MTNWTVIQIWQGLVVADIEPNVDDQGRERMELKRSVGAFVLAAATVAAAVAAPAAWAQPAAEPATGPAGATGSTGSKTAAPMEMPKPNPMLDQLKYLAGSWKCTGSGYTEGKAHPTTAQVKAAWDLNGYFLGLRYQERKTKDNPMPVTAVEHMGYGAELNKLIAGFIDSMGGYGTQATSPRSNTVAGHRGG
jgi:hypothetical protein